jgi:hypothetical protein
MTFAALGGASWAALWLLCGFFRPFQGFSVLSGRTKAFSFSQETSGAHQIAQGEDGITLHFVFLQPPIAQLA